MSLTFVIIIEINFCYRVYDAYEILEVPIRSIEPNIHLFSP